MSRCVQTFDWYCKCRIYVEHVNAFVWPAPARALGWCSTRRVPHAICLLTSMRGPEGREERQREPLLEDNMGPGGPGPKARQHLNQHNHFFHFDSEAPKLIQYLNFSPSCQNYSIYVCMHFI